VIITLCGNNHFLIRQELKKLVSEFTSEHTDMALESFDGDELVPDQLDSTVQALPFLTEKRMVIVKNGSGNKPLAEKLEQILKNTTDTTDLVFVEEHPDKRSVYYKTLKKMTDFREYNELDINGLSRWLVDEAKSRGGSISIADANYLVKRVGTNQTLLGNELEKLLNYTPAITKQSIDLLTEQTPQSTIFELLDAAFAGNMKKAMELYEDQRKQKVEPLAILAMIAWQLHSMAIVKTAGQQSSEDVAKKAKLNPFVVRKTQNIVRKLSVSEIKSLIGRTLELDIRLKSVSIDADEALKSLILTIALKK
jgi:DNA polymerase-3 subunit delta